MGKMLAETAKTKTILISKQLKLSGKTVDLTEMLSRKGKISREYRQEELDKFELDKRWMQKDMCKFKVVPVDSFDCTKYCDGNIAVLNFASSKNPGGGFEVGAMAQEESLCYRSNLWQVLSKHESFYEFNRQHLNKNLYSDGIIYSEKIVVFRNAKLANTEPVYQNVITCAAPNAKAALKNGVKQETIDLVMRRRLEEIFKVAIINKVKHLVLGAFGCGVFGNNPETVSEIMRELLVDNEYGRYFKQVTFAMHDSVGANTRAFVKTFNKIK